MHEKEIEKLQAEKEKSSGNLRRNSTKSSGSKTAPPTTKRESGRKRAHRLITRGAAIESVAPQTKDLSETAFYAFVEQVFALPDTQRLLAEAVGSHAGGD